MKKGCVSLVGAGPGDPELLTIKALDRIRRADLIVYDTLANPRHLVYAKKTAHCVCVGKDFRHKKLSQDKINRLILREARKGKNVLRLKGGDPYLFGRGGEEALYLVNHNIPFEVIPGITSANGCAAYAGIPLTHRDHNASVTFLTGHRAHDEKLDSVDWKTIVSSKGTLAIYMGFYNLKKITERLILNGMKATTPVAVVQWGTLPEQKSVDGTLENIADRVRQRGFKAPCMILVGPVVRLRQKLNWFERLPLFGKKILLTRLREKSGALESKFTALGASVAVLPTVEIKKKPDLSAMDEAIRSLARYDWAVFGSSYGVEAFFERLASHGKDARSLQGMKIACVGSETAQALKQRGIRPDLVPPRFEMNALAHAMASRGSLRGKRILLLRADIAPPDLERRLRQWGAQTKAVTAYRTIGVKISNEKIKNLFKDAPDFITFTSASSVSYFVKALGLRRARRLAAKSIFASIGPVTTGALNHHGLKSRCQASVFNTDGLVQAVQQFSGR